MVKIYTPKFPRFSLHLILSLLFISIFYAPTIHAAQQALVIVDKAVIYSDMDMTSPIGYISRGKKIAVGDTAKNKFQVYPLIISGKIAYIRVADVSTEKEGPTSKRLTAERFSRKAEEVPKMKYSLSYLQFNSAISSTKKNYKVENNDPFTWSGFSMKGEMLWSKDFDFQVLFNYLGATTEEETYKMLELGTGLAWRIINKPRWQFRTEGQVMLVPFSSYAIKSDFRKNSYGYTLGGGASLDYYFNEFWGLELSGGLYYTKLLGFELPAPYQNVAPVFIGSRIALGLSYQY